MLLGDILEEYHLYDLINDLRQDFSVHVAGICAWWILGDHKSFDLKFFTHSYWKSYFHF